MSSLSRRKRRHHARRGQALVEMALILPILLLIVLGTLEFAFALDHHLTLQYASREGARTGAALSNGGGDPDVCATIDSQVIAAVERVLVSPGSSIETADVVEIRIFRAGASGEQLGSPNRWTHAPASGPVVDGEALDFRQASEAWPACARISQPTPDSIGVSVDYTYRFRTPLTSLFNWISLAMHDQTVMPLAPTDP